jgi:hypothetical protein
LDRVEVHDKIRTYTFTCEHWLSKSKEDKRLERSIYEKDYTGPRTESASSMTLKSSIGGSQQLPGSRADSFRSASSRQKKPRLEVSVKRLKDQQFRTLLYSKLVMKAMLVRQHKCLLGL